MFEQMIIPLRKYADFSGRAARSEFWFFMLFCAVATTLAGVFGPLIAGLVALLLICPQVAVGVRRLHDVGRSGKELVLPYAMIVAAPFVYAFKGVLMKLVALGYVGLLLLICAHLVLLLIKPGSKIPNKYGPAPDAFSFAKAN